MVDDSLPAMPMYPWVAHRWLLSLQYVMDKVPIHYYGWIWNIHDERVMLPTAHPTDSGEMAGQFRPPISENVKIYFQGLFYLREAKKTLPHLTPPTWTTIYCQKENGISWQNYAWTKKKSYQLQSSRSPCRTTKPISSLSPTIYFVLPPLTGSDVLV